MNPEAEELIHRYLDGTATPGEAAALAALLSGDPEAAARFAELTRVDEALRVELKAENRALLFTKRLSRLPEAVPASLPDRRRWLAAAAALILLGSGAWWLSDVPGPQALGKRWAASQLKRELPDLPEIRATTGSGPTANPAAALRRELRGFALPWLHLRDMPVSEALAVLNRQWFDLPHAGGTKGTDLPILLSPEARAAWTSLDQEPRVTVDIPEITLHTALQLLAAQAGLKLEIAAQSITLEPDPRSHDSGEKTWTFPVAKSQVDAFLSAMDPRTDFMATLSRSHFFMTHRSASPELTGSKVSIFPKEFLTATDVTFAGTPALAGTEITHNPNASTDSLAGEAIIGRTFEVTLTNPVESGDANLSGTPPGAGLASAATVSPALPEAATSAGSSAAVYTGLTEAPHLEYSFIHPGSPDKRSLPGWLGTFGLPQDSHNYDPSDGVLTVTGNHRTLHTAAAAVAALTESAQSGVSMEMRIIPSPEGSPLMFPGGKQGDVAAVDASEVAQWLKPTASSPQPPGMATLPTTLSLRDRKISYQINGGMATVSSSQNRNSTEEQISLRALDDPALKILKMEAAVTAGKAGGGWNLTVEVQGNPGKGSQPFSLREGQWMALRLGHQNGILLMRPKTAAILP